MPYDPRMQVTGATPGSIRTYTYVYRQWAAQAGIKSGLVSGPAGPDADELSFISGEDDRLCG